MHFDRHICITQRELQVHFLQQVLIQ